MKMMYIKASSTMYGPTLPLGIKDYTCSIISSSEQVG